MELLNFFKRVNKKGIKLVVKNGLLNVKSNSNIEPELLLEIKANKDIIIEYLEKFHAIAEKKWGALSNETSTKAKQKFINYLQYRGWETNLIFEELNEIENTKK